MPARLVVASIVSASLRRSRVPQVVPEQLPVARCQEQVLAAAVEPERGDLALDRRASATAAVSSVACWPDQGLLLLHGLEHELRRRDLGHGSRTAARGGHAPVARWAARDQGRRRSPPNVAFGVTVRSPSVKAVSNLDLDAGCPPVRRAERRSDPCRWWRRRSRRAVQPGDGTGGSRRPSLSDWNLTRHPRSRAKPARDTRRYPTESPRRGPRRGVLAVAVVPREVAPTATGRGARPRREITKRMARIEAMMMMPARRTTAAEVQRSTERCAGACGPVKRERAGAGVPARRARRVLRMMATTGSCPALPWRSEAGIGK